MTSEKAASVQHNEMTNMMSELNASAARDQVRSMMVRQFWRERTTAYSMDDNNDVQELLTRMAKCSSRGGKMNLVVLSICPSLEHSATNVMFDTQHLMTALARAFHDSSTNPADDICFVDLATIDRHIFQTPKPPYKWCEAKVEAIIFDASSDLNTQIHSNLDRLVNTFYNTRWIIQSDIMACRFYNTKHQVLRREKNCGLLRTRVLIKLCIWSLG